MTTALPLIRDFAGDVMVRGDAAYDEARPELRRRRGPAAAPRRVRARVWERLESIRAEWDPAGVFRTVPR